MGLFRFVSMLEKRKKNHEARKAAAAAAAAAASSETAESNITSSATKSSVETAGMHFKHLWLVDSLFQAPCS